MPAMASIEELRELQGTLDKLKGEFPEAYKLFSEMFQSYRRIGYKNICKLLLGEATPEKLKGMDG